MPSRPLPLAAIGTLLCLLDLLALAPGASGAVTVPSFFSDHMVLQRDLPLAVWGWAESGESVTVQLGDKPAVHATALANGTWRALLPATAAGGPYPLVIKGRNELRIEDVLVGEVWLCSGQSNMEMGVGGCLDFAREKSAATDGQIRQLAVPKRPLSLPEARMDARWSVCSPDAVGGFTACGYFMARELRKSLKVPVGIINSSWGGTRIEPWIPAAAFGELPALKGIAKELAQLDPANPAYRQKLSGHVDQIEAWARRAKEALAAGGLVDPQPALPAELEPLAKRKDAQQQPTTLYNGMIAPLAGYGLRGAIWYQGESNHYEGPLYTEKMKALVAGWRKVWGQGDFPFNFVQIAPFRYGNEDAAILARFWVAQSAARLIPGVGMAVISDIGALDDIHPRNKQEVGRRLALIALNRTYGQGGVECMGPEFKELAVEGARLRLRFDHAQGLATRDGKAPSWFELLGEEGDWTPAEAAIDGTSVVLTAAKVARPVAARFAWSKLAEANLVNAAGLPAPAFATASGAPYVDHLPLLPEAKGYELVYELDLASLGSDPAYAIDRSATTGRFDRIAYFLELQPEGKPLQYAFASMDAFTSEVRKIGVPVLASGAFFQQTVANLTVASNVPGLPSGTSATGGNIEFWPNNYGPGNSAGIPGAADNVYDFGDQPGDPQDGYGSMQVHHFGQKTTIFAINNFKAGAGCDLGIGNSTGDTRDWTFKANAGSYPLKKLRVLVHPQR